MKRHKTHFNCGKMWLILGVLGDGAALKIYLKCGNYQCSFPIDSSSDILEFISCGKFSWALSCTLWSPHGCISLTVWTETAVKQLECVSENRTFVCFDTSVTWKCIIFFVWVPLYFSLWVNWFVCIVQLQHPPVACWASQWQLDTYGKGKCPATLAH